MAVLFRHPDMYILIVQIYLVHIDFSVLLVLKCSSYCFESSGMHILLFIVLVFVWYAFCFAFLLRRMLRTRDAVLLGAGLGRYVFSHLVRFVLSGLVRCVVSGLVRFVVSGLVRLFFTSSKVCSFRCSKVFLSSLVRFVVWGLVRFVGCESCCKINIKMMIYAE